MSGIELTREIQRLYPAIHVLALTSDADGATRDAMREAGASGYIIKGNSERLASALEAAQAVGPDRRRSRRSRAIASI